MAGEGYIGAGGQRFMSSVLAKASQPGGYTRTIYHKPRTRTTSLSHAARLAFGKALEQYQPGGAYGEGVEATLERGRTKAVAGGQQALVSAGLAGTSMLAAPGQRFEEEVAMPTRARVEELRAGRLSEIYAMLAEAEQRGFESAEERAFRTRPTLSPVGVGDYKQPIESGGFRISTPDFSMSTDRGGFSPVAAGAQARSRIDVGSVPYGRRIAPTIEEPSPWTLPRATNILGEWGY